jgi:hypothetical protein
MVSQTILDVKSGGNQFAQDRKITIALALVSLPHYLYL